MVTFTVTVMVIITVITVLLLILVITTAVGIMTALIVLRVSHTVFIAVFAVVHSTCLKVKFRFENEPFMFIER